MMKKISDSKLHIISVFIENQGKELFVREIERLGKIDIKILNRDLKELVDGNVLDYAVKGKIKTYSLKNNIDSELLLMMTEIYRTKKFLLAYRKLKISLSELNAETDFAIFGSYASMTADSSSDIDVVIFSKDSKRIRDIIKNFQVSVHPHFIAFGEFEKLSPEKHRLLAEILKSHILFGKQKEFSRMVIKWTKN